MGSKANILVTCGGKWVGTVLQLRQAMQEVPLLQNGRLYVADRAAITPAGHFADGSFVVPPIGHPDYIDSLLEVCRRAEVRVLLPLIDIDQVRLARHGKRFSEAGTTLVSPPAEPVELLFDKDCFHRFAVAADLPVPKRIALEELETADYPLFYKPIRGYGGIGAGRCNSLAEARRACSCRDDLMFQEFVGAPEVSIDCYISPAGVPTVRVPRIRDKVVDGEVMQSHTVRLPDVNALAIRTLEALAGRGVSGPVTVQVFAAEEPMLIEANPRLGSGNVLSNVATGGRLLRSVLAGACGLPVIGDPDDYRDGLYLYRYLGDVIHDGSAPFQVFPRMAA
ncbi:MAG: ATP-grasp domain-containing protein [Pirellulales bacterium]|nr:ATP-grasp domain-containing protein [Pirellulales bacterium]